MARSMLDSNGIDAVVWSAGVGANVPFDDTIAHRVMVRADDAPEARKLVAAIRSAYRADAPDSRRRHLAIQV
jgi:hypothetical protein